jgi:hypothetical protein
MKAATAAIIGEVSFKKTLLIQVDGTCTTGVARGFAYRHFLSWRQLSTLAEHAVAAKKEAAKAAPRKSLREHAVMESQSV